MGVSIDLEKAHKHRVIGQFRVIYTWMKVGQDADNERAMVLIPRYRQKAPWYIVFESAAYKYDDPEYLASQCMIACDVMGMEPSKNNWVKIATIINEGLPDLIEMPSSPADEMIKAEFGRMQLKADGKTVAEEAIKFNTPSAEYA